MPQNRNNFITAKPLENVALDVYFSMDDLVHRQATTPLPVDRSKIKVYQTDLRALRRIVSDERGTNSEPDMIDEDLFGREISLSEYKLRGEVNPRNVRDADVPSLLSQARVVKTKAAQLALAAEKRFATMALDANNYQTALKSTITDGSYWTQSGGSPLNDKRTIDLAMVKACGRTANAAIMGFDVFTALCLSPEFMSRTQYTQKEVPDYELVKKYLRLEYLFIGKSVYNSAAEGQTATNVFMWAGNDVVFFHHDPRMPSAEDPGQNAFLMLHSGPLFWTNTLIDQNRTGPAGSMQVIDVGAEYMFAAGMVESSSSTDFQSAYLLSNVIA